MASQYFLPAVGGRTTSPPAKAADSTSSNESNATIHSYALPSLTKNHSRLSIGSNSSKSARLPLTSIPTNESKKLHPSDSNSSRKSLDSNSILDATEPMQVDVVAAPPPQMVETLPVEKTMDLVYPCNVKLPSRSLVQALFDEAMKMDVDSDEDGDQKDLCDAGLLSLEQVLLPAVAYQEEQMLKEWQSIVQRDGSAQEKAHVIGLRKAVYSGIGAACAAVQQSRLQRAPGDQARERQWQLELQEKQAAIAEERQKHAAMVQQQRQEVMRKRKCDLQKKLPANQDVWREVAYLMTELAKLSQEEQQWRHVAAQHLDRTEALLMEQERQYEAQSKPDAPVAAATASVQHVVAGATDTALDIALAVDRIRNALSHVAHTATRGEQSRQQLYHQYVTHHQFYGYQGIHDPKGLLKVLSQSQQSE